MSIKTTIAKYGLGKMIDQLYEDPQKGMQTIMSWADKFSRGEFVQQREVFRKIFENEDDPYNGMIRKMLTDIDRSVFEKILVNFFVNANLAGWPVLKRTGKNITATSHGRSFLIRQVPAICTALAAGRQSMATS